MNAKQIRALQTLTKQTWLEWKTGQHIDGRMSFSATEYGDTVFIHGSNTDSIEWYEKQFIVQMFIGPRGGLNKITTH